MYWAAFNKMPSRVECCLSWPTLFPQLTDPGAGAIFHLQRLSNHKWAFATGTPKACLQHSVPQPMPSMGCSDTSYWTLTREEGCQHWCLPQREPSSTLRPHSTRTKPEAAQGKKRIPGTVRYCEANEVMPAPASHCPKFLYSQFNNSPQLQSSEVSSTVNPSVPCLSEFHTRLIFYLHLLTKTNSYRVQSDNIPE